LLSFPFPNIAIFILLSVNCVNATPLDAFDPACHPFEPSLKLPTALFLSRSSRVQRLAIGLATQKFAFSVGQRTK
jgi:hypothetical protein